MPFLFLELYNNINSLLNFYLGEASKKDWQLFSGVITNF